MKTVLLVGDSIRIGYQDRVRELLGENYTVYTIDENCRYTKFTLWGMFSWTEGMGIQHFDLIHWNTGIWDLHRATADGEIFTSLEDYVKENKRLYLQMKSYSDNLIWATIIPGGRQLDDQVKSNALINTDASHPKVFLCADQKTWNSDVRRYNDAAKKMYEENGVKINDLYAAVADNTDLYISDDGIHPSPAGYEVLAQQTAKIIRAQLAD